MFLDSEVGAKRAVEAVFHGMPVTCALSEWPAIREVLLVQADAWESLGKVGVAAAARWDIVRLNALALTATPFPGSYPLKGIL